jgi:hypothetical protein
MVGCASDSDFTGRNDIFRPPSDDRAYMGRSPASAKSGLACMRATDGKALIHFAILSFVVTWPTGGPPGFPSRDQNPYFNIPDLL